jgi:hypothetical protein
MTEYQLADADAEYLRATAATIRKDIGRLKISLSHARQLLEVLALAAKEDDLQPAIGLVNGTLDVFTDLTIAAHEGEDRRMSSVHIGKADVDMAERAARCLGLIQSTRDRG